MTVPYSAAYLVDLFNRLTGRPPTDKITDATKCTWLSEAQNEVVSEIATIAPWVLYQKSALPLLSTTDNNIFTFGNDTNGEPIAPIGDVQIYRALSDVPDMPLIPDWDYLGEGTQIRWPRGRTYSGTLYWRGIVMPAPIDSVSTPNVDPAFNPRPMNELTAIRAALNFAESAGLRNPALADRMKIRWGHPMTPGRPGRFAYWMLVLKRQFTAGGALTATTLSNLAFPLK